MHWRPARVSTHDIRFRTPYESGSSCPLYLNTPKTRLSPFIPAHPRGPPSSPVIPRHPPSSPVIPQGLLVHGMMAVISRKLGDGGGVGPSKLGMGGGAALALARCQYILRRLADGLIGPSLRPAAAMMVRRDLDCCLMPAFPPRSIQMLGERKSSSVHSPRPPSCLHRKMSPTFAFSHSSLAF